MKHFLFALLFGLIYVASTKAQDTRYVGTWIYHYPGYYVDGEEIWPKRDEYLRIDETDGKLYISIKRGKDGSFWGYSEATHVQLSEDGFLSFNEGYDNIVKHDDGRTSHCYNSYCTWIKGRTLYVRPTLEFYWYYPDGRLQSHTSSEWKPDAIWVYHNEKDNW